MRLLTASDLLGARPTRPIPLDAASGSATSQLAAQQASPPADLLAALDRLGITAPNSPPGIDYPLGQAAWQAYQALYAPLYPAPPQLSALRQRYTGQVWSLVAAARWASSPYPLASCQLDPDHDGQPECLLASDRFYAQFEIADASLTYLFADYIQNWPPGWADAAHQLIGPSSQLITGLSSPETWQLDAGLLADPSTIPGAFAGPGIGFQPEIVGDTLVFSLPDGRVVKSYRLTASGLQVDYRLAGGEAYPPAQLPLLIDPWRRFSRGWADLYHLQSSPNQVTWQLQDAPAIQVSASTSLSGADFSQSRPLFAAAEDPNQDFPAAHFAPFPLALLQVQLQEHTMITIQVSPQP